MWAGERKHRRARGRRSGSLLVFGAQVPLLALVAAIAALTPSTALAQGEPGIGIDADPAGNQPTSLATVDPCVSVEAGDTFSVDIFVRDVQELLAWQVYLEFDPDVVEISGRDVEMFLKGNPGSSVLDASGEPGRAGLYEVSAADTSDPPTPDSGSGVLARLELRAIDDGATDLELISRDIDNDGQDDLGPLLRNVDAQIIGDTDDDSIFDGPVENAQVVVGGPCEDMAPPQDSEPNSASDDGDGGVNLALIVIAAVVGTAVVGAGGLAAFRLLRRQRPTIG